MGMEPIEYTEHKYGVDVAVSDVKVDLAVQRAIVPARLRKLIGNFAPVLLGELLVSERQDGLYILDGQHRLEATKRANGNGVSTVTCEIFAGLSKADEARLFMGRNDRAGVAAVDRDRNLATSGDQATLDVQMAAQSAGFIFVADRAEDSTFRDRTAGVAIMRDAERRKYVEISGPEHLSRVFTFYARAYGNQERPESVLLKALSKVFVSKSEVDEDRLYDKLRGLPAQQITAMAAQRKVELSVTRGVSTVRAAVEVVAEQYNRGLPADSAKRIRL
jgi:hypothetical protein